MIDDGRPAVRAPDHLYTWLDVSEHFTALAEAEAWPRWLVEVDAYWDAARFVVSPSVEESTIWSWLTDVLGPLTVVPERRQLMLEDAGTERTLPVEIERAETAPLLDRRPRWTDRRVVASISEPLRPPASERLPHEMVLAAFHSFKGGVGRTLHCVAVARALASAGVRVLLVDADLEAPGITWMVSESLRIDFSFEDFLALVHGAADPNYHDAISLGRKFLANQELDGVVVMPARRDFERIAPPKIKPDDLLTADRGPYVLTEVLAELGHAIGAQVVLVDLRAGASELSAPLLLDPRVHRVLVTTISHQSVQGTLRVLQQLARRAPATREFDPDCTLLVTQFDEENHDTALASVVAQLRPAALAVSKTFEESAVDDATVDLDLAVPVLRSPFDPHLLSLPATWEDVLSRAQGANLGAHLRDLALALRSASQPEPPEPQDTAPVDINERRRRLADTADNLIYAEASAGEDFLATEPLRNLVEAHRTEVPIEVVIGGKGSGKTFTHLQLCTAASWDRFAEAAGVEGVTQRAPIVPVLASTTLRRERQEQLSELLSEAAARITGGTAAGMTGVRQFVQEHLAADTDELSWRRVWLAGLGRAVGLDTEPGRAERDLTGLARHHQMIFVIDGLEDLFQEFTTNRNQQRALRALLIDCPEWLRTLRGRPLGLIVFVRRDIAQAARPQNFGQFEKRYQKYALRWNTEEALRLAAWVCHRGGALAATEEEIKAAGTRELSRLLLAIWGDKMGSPRSREARSESWFFAALSDFNGQIQARDIVSFLAEAAEKSIGDPRWQDRILAPAAMRNALRACSSRKIDEIKEENPPVGALLKRLSSLPHERRKVPFRLADVDLSLDDATLLSTNGILFQEEDQYWIPEIYRHGLGFRASGRPRVVNVANLVRRRNDPTT